MRALGVAMPATMGHLHLFWHWVLEFAPNGDISFDRFTCEDIADGALWEGDAYAFLEALVTAGFVDRNDDRLAVHEWHEYGGAYFEKLERDRERKRNRGNPEESPVVPAASDGFPMERAGIPWNSTAFPQKNRKEKEEIREEKNTEHTARAPEPEADDFTEFFADYPRHDAKVEAERAWRKLKPDARLRAMSSLALWKACEQWEQPRYVPQAATFLNQRRFDDTPPPRSPARASPTNGHYERSIDKSTAAIQRYAERHGITDDDTLERSPVRAHLTGGSLSDRAADQ